MFKNNLNPLALLTLTALISGSNVYAQTDSFTQKIQTIVDSYLANAGKQERVSGIEVSISYPDKQKIQTKNLVAGHLTHDKNAKPVIDTTLFDIGSITKSYTAAIILQLQAEGRLDINDPIGKWLPQYAMWKNVTIKQLLNMTSGIPNYSGDPKFGDYLPQHMEGEYPDEFLLSFAHPDQPVTPGVKYEYSNSNYILAGMIIETITKQNFTDVLQERILGPLNLKDTYYAAGPNWKYVNKITFPRKAHGYYYDAEKNKLMDLTKVNLSWGGAAGAIVSTSADQIKWVDALYHGTLFPEKSRAKLLDALQSVVSMKTGQPILNVDKNDPAGFGLGIASIYEQNQRFRVYEGGTLGYRMFYLWKPCNNVIVVAALNSKTDSSSPSGDSIKNLALDIYNKIIQEKPGLMCTD